jgi:hypothetical protein
MRSRSRSKGMDLGRILAVLAQDRTYRPDERGEGVRHG